MNPEQFIDDILGSETGSDGLSKSDQVYLEFRQTVDPGMFDAEFDVTPAKSCAIRSRQTGEPHTDQTLRSHVLNGAAFGARLNHALKQLGSEAALSEQALRTVLALYTCHDLHKTRSAQRRRAQSTSRSDADKDISEQETERYVSLLRLRELDTDLELADYRASALAAEERSGRHRDAPSRTFDNYRAWIRVMDAAAGLDTPSVSEGLQRRVADIAPEVTLTSHSLDDVKGLSTNILHTTLVEELRDTTPAVPVVYFVNGALYLVPEDADIIERFRAEGATPATLTESYIATLRETRPEFSDPERMTSGLNEDYQKGNIKIPSSMYLLSGATTSLQSVRHLLRDRSKNTTWGEYNTYEYAMQVGVSSGLVTDPLPSTEKTIPLGLQLSAYYGELYYPLSGEDRRAAIRHMSEALEIPEVGAWVADETTSWRLTYTDEHPPDDTLRRLAERFERETTAVAAELESGVHLSSGGTRSFPMLIAAAFLQSTDASGARWGERPLPAALEAIEERLLSYYQSWPAEWDDTAPVSSDAADAATKVDDFERRKQGLIWKSYPEYIKQNLQLDGQPVFEMSASKTKFDQYERGTQPQVCLLCDDVLVGAGSLEEFKTTNIDGLSLGFSHYKQIDPAGGEPESTVCPQCQLELTLRDSVYDISPDGDLHYLFLAPDYFYAPGDIRLEQRIRRAVYFAGGYTLLQFARSVVIGDETNRASIVEDIYAQFADSRDEADGEAFRNTVKNYDARYEQDGTLGVFEFDPPRRGTDNPDPITRIPSWLASSLVAVGMAWLTSSRVLLTETPIPATGFDEFAEQVYLDHIPGAVQRYSGDTASISYRRDLGVEPEEYRINSVLTESSMPDDADTGPDSAEVSKSEPIEEAQAEIDAFSGDSTESAESETGLSRRSVSLRLETDLEIKLYRLASLFTVTFRAHGTEIQRVKTVLDRAADPFPGGETMLKGDEQNSDTRALHSALVLDTLLYPTMSNRIEALANAGFDTLQPDASSESNYEYERLFRVAREAISDGLAQNASREELVDIVTGDVMKAAARAENPDYDDVSYKRESAEEFATIFVHDVFDGLCDGDFYELRRHENHLASGYNAAIRRRLQEFFDNHSE